MGNSLKSFMIFLSRIYRRRKNVITSSIKIQDPYATLEAIKQAIQKGQCGAYLRFGDGDINLMYCQDDQYQAAHKNLAKEMKEAFSLSGPGIYKCLPLHCARYGVLPNMRPGIHEVQTEWAENILHKTYQYFIGNSIYSHVALSYVTAYDFDYAVQFYRFLRSNHIVFVGNKNADSSVLFKLLGSVKHIKTPDKDSFARINEVTDELACELDSCKQYTVVVVAMGCSGRILEKRIIKMGYMCFLFDLGSVLDIFLGQKSRAWMVLDQNIKDDHYNRILDCI